MQGRRLVLAGGACWAAGASAAAAPSSTLPMAARALSRADLTWWQTRHLAKLQEKAARGRIDLVFLGDSITQQYEQSGPPQFLDYRSVWDRFYGDRRALNLGFKGDATSHLLWRIENHEIEAITPQVAIILVGANNFGHLHWSADDTVRGIEAVVAATRQRLPRTRIILLSVLPSDRGAWVQQSTARTNGALAARFGAGEVGGVHFLDLTGIFTRGGRIDVSQYADPRLAHPAAALHPDAAGQARMAAAIEPTLMRLMGDRDHRA